MNTKHNGLKITGIVLLLFVTLFVSSLQINHSTAAPAHQTTPCPDPTQKSVPLIPTNTPSGNNIPATAATTVNCGTNHLIYVKPAEFSEQARPEPTGSPISFSQNFTTEACETVNEACITQKGAGTQIGFPFSVQYYPDLTSSANQRFFPISTTDSMTTQGILTLTPNDGTLYTLTSFNYLATMVVGIYNENEFSWNDITDSFKLEFLDAVGIPLRGTTINCTLELEPYVTICDSFSFSVKGVKSIRITRTVTNIQSTVIWYEEIIDDVAIYGFVQSEPTPAPTRTPKNSCSTANINSNKVGTSDEDVVALAPSCRPAYDPADCRQNARLISTTSDDVAGAPYSEAPSISSQGGFAVFKSFAPNLSSAGTSAIPMIYFRDKDNTTLISANGSGQLANGYSDHPHISGDGKFVVLESDATNLTTHTITAGATNIFVWGSDTGQITLVSQANGQAFMKGAYYPAISADGKYIVFESFESGTFSQIYVSVNPLMGSNASASAITSGNDTSR